MSLSERIAKYRRPSKHIYKHGGEDYDYAKALGRAEYNRIREIVELEAYKSCARTHGKLTNEN